MYTETLTPPIFKANCSTITDLRRLPGKIVNVTPGVNASISLTEAAKLQNASTGSLEVVNKIFNCGTVCFKDGRCKCFNAKQLCTSHCHVKMKGKPICCKNHDKRGGVGKDAYNQELASKIKKK